MQDTKNYPEVGKFYLLKYKVSQEMYIWVQRCTAKTGPNIFELYEINVDTRKEVSITTYEEYLEYARSSYSIKEIGLMEYARHRQL